jgi:hypothetical protein
MKCDDGMVGRQYTMYVYGEIQMQSMICFKAVNMCNTITLNYNCASVFVRCVCYIQRQ